MNRLPCSSSRNRCSILTVSHRRRFNCPGSWARTRSGSTTGTWRLLDILEFWVAVLVELLNLHNVYSFGENLTFRADVVGTVGSGKTQLRNRLNISYSMLSKIFKKNVDCFVESLWFFWPSLFVFFKHLEFMYIDKGFYINSRGESAPNARQLCLTREEQWVSVEIWDMTYSIGKMRNRWFQIYIQFFPPRLGTFVAIFAF